MKRREVILKTGLGLGAISAINLSYAGKLFSGISGNLIKRKIYLFSKHLHWAGYGESAQIAADIGYDGLDLTVRPKGHVLPENVERDLPKAVKAAERKGLEIKVITTAITDADSPETEKILKTASELGIKYYRLGWFNYDDSISVLENINRFGDALKKIGELNAKYQIIGDYQNHAGTSAGSPVWDIYEMLKITDSPFLGVQYDIRHAMVEGMNSWPLGLRLLYPFIHTIDIKDFIWMEKDGKRVIENVPLGQGEVDFKAYFRLLNELKVEAPISVHLEYPLGGANHGDFEITLPREKVIEAMSNDLAYLKSVM